MPDSVWSESTVLADWAEEECRHLDLIASWEVLISAYSALGFTDVIDDERRLAEFKLVIGELNKFLTRMRNGLGKTKDVDAAVAFLAGNANLSDMNSVKNRPSIAYNKLKQRWIAQSISTLLAAKAVVEEQEREGDDDR
jgi:hypothetical protein